MRGIYLTYTICNSTSFYHFWICNINRFIQDEEQSDEEGSSTKKSNKNTTASEDEDFEATSNSEDDEDTIQEQEQVEGKTNHQEELDDLKAENEMSIEELKKKYSGLASTASVEETSSEESTEKTEESSAEESGSDVEMETEEDESQESEVGLKSLLDDSHGEGEDTKTDKNNDLINDAAAIAESIQPKGNTLSSTSVSKQKRERRIQYLNAFDAN